MDGGIYKPDPNIPFNDKTDVRDEKLYILRKSIYIIMGNPYIKWTSFF